MKQRERWEYLGRAPRIVWEALALGRYRFQYDCMPITVRGMSAAQRLNLLRAGLNLFWRRLRPWSRPLHMQVELTSYCNLRCPVCPVGTEELERPAQAIEVDLVERVMQEVGPYLLTVSLWGWGEPLLHKKLDRILEITARYPMARLLSTNGQNLPEPRVQEALRAHPPTYLIVALDGLCDETNSVYRRGARIEPILEGVRQLAEWKRREGARLPILHCRFMAMRHNEHELPDLLPFAERAGFEMVSIRTLGIIDSRYDYQSWMTPAVEPLRAYEYRDGRRVRRNDFVCQYAFSFPTLLADGRLVACDQDYNGRHAYGVIGPGVSFSSVWRSARAAAVRRVVRENPEEFSFCRQCPYADRPISSCSIRSYFLRDGTAKSAC